ncbi:hypothetical protein ABD68_00530 [Bacillus endophyticus]|jgi:hypothetical protein|nr:hypothetical protein [Priestia endophytica]
MKRKSVKPLSLKGSTLFYFLEPTLCELKMNMIYIHFQDEIGVLLVSTYCLITYTKRGPLF